MDTLRKQGFMLPDLPADIIRLIISVGLYSIDAMKLISHRWNTIANEHLQTRRNLPVMETLYIKFKYSRIVELGVQIHKRARNYFGVSAWKANKNLYFHGVFRNESCQWYKKLLNKHKIPEFNVVSGRCSKIYTLILEVDMNFKKTADVIRQLSRILVAERIVCTKMPEYQTQSLHMDFIRPSQTKHLLFMSSFALPALEIALESERRLAFFADAMQLLSTIEIIMINDHKSSLTSLQYTVNKCANKIQLASVQLRSTRVFNNIEVKQLNGKECVWARFSIDQ